jgi:DNA-binding PadR family transcriptional regulator
VDIGDQGHAVLTIVALRGPSSAYDIERFLDLLSGEYWSVPHTQLYRECAQLESAGLLGEKQEKGGRKRRIYSLTKKGRDAVTVWVRTPTDQTMQIRDVAQIKLLASELSTAEDIRTLALRQVADYDRRLELLDTFESRYADPTLALRIRNIAMGRAVYEAAREFWMQVADDPLPPET